MVVSISLIPKHKLSGIGLFQPEHNAVLAAGSLVTVVILSVSAELIKPNEQPGLERAGAGMASCLKACQRLRLLFSFGRK
jgi:hypothetical protein